MEDFDPSHQQYLQLRRICYLCIDKQLPVLFETLPDLIRSDIPLLIYEYVLHQQSKPLEEPLLRCLLDPSIDRSMDGWIQSINQSIKMIASMIGYLRWIFERHGHFRPYDGHTPVWIGRSCLIGCEVKGLRSVPHFRYVPKEDTMWYFTPADPLVSGSSRGEANTIYV